MTDLGEQHDVLFEKRGNLGLITLNRPRAINALNHGMVLAIRGTLDNWAHDDEVKVVALTGAGERGLCAGGDIVSIYEDARSGHHNGASTFWRDEYELNSLIGSYPKPFVAVMDGIVLGGGIGLSAHANRRTVTEKSSIGLPETTIGFVPDVGGTWLLSRAPGQLGVHLALTAGSFDAGTAIAIGFADYFVPSDRLPQLIESLEATGVDDAISAVAEQAPESALMSERSWIDAAYDSSSALEIVQRLRASGFESAAAAASTIVSKSPTGVAVTLESLRRAAKLTSLEEVLEQEYRVAVHSLDWPDLAEGIRAQVIDKDRDPQWKPATLAEVSLETVATAFEPLPASLPELHFSPPSKG